MGNIIQASCTCGYSSGQMMQGLGFSFMETGIVYEPAYCDACGITLAVEGNAPLPACSNCNGPLTLYNPHGAATREDCCLPDSSWLQKKKFRHCPACKKESLQFNILGSWD